MSSADYRESLRACLGRYAEALASLANRAAFPQTEIVRGYRQGIIARITQMHALYYARTSGFGQRFESVVAGGLAVFCDRPENSRNAIWSAVQGNEVVGSIAIDGEDKGAEIAHLRWFIVDDGVRGGGVGRKLLSTALAFVDAQGFAGKPTCGLLAAYSPRGISTRPWLCPH
jgi:GNAT superfamily N-acetyltransferase